MVFFVLLLMEPPATMVVAEQEPKMEIKILSLGSRAGQWRPMYVFKPKVVGGVNIVAAQHPFSGSFVQFFKP